jgi:phage gp46-like protein
MPWDLVFDPQTKDLVRDGAGGWQRTTTGDTAVRNQLEVRYASWWGDAAIGSLLYDRGRFTAAPGPLVAAEVRRALGLLVTEQYIADLETDAKQTRQGRVEGRSRYRLVDTGELVNLELPNLGG